MVRTEPSDSAAREILGYSFLRVFASDGTLDADELAMIRRLALRDGVVDSKERAVLSRIFDRIDLDRMDPALREQIVTFRREHRIR